MGLASVSASRWRIFRSVTNDHWACSAHISHQIWQNSNLLDRRFLWIPAHAYIQTLTHQLQHWHYNNVTVISNYHMKYEQLNTKQLTVMTRNKQTPVNGWLAGSYTTAHITQSTYKHASQRSVDMCLLVCPCVSGSVCIMVIAASALKPSHQWLLLFVLWTQAR